MGMAEAKNNARRTFGGMISSFWTVFVENCLDRVVCIDRIRMWGGMRGRGMRGEDVKEVHRRWAVKRQEASMSKGT